MWCQCNSCSVIGGYGSPSMTPVLVFSFSFYDGIFFFFDFLKIDMPICEGIITCGSSIDVWCHSLLRYWDTVYIKFKDFETSHWKLVSDISTGRWSVVDIWCALYMFDTFIGGKKDFFENWWTILIMGNLLKLQTNRVIVTIHCM